MRSKPGRPAISSWRRRQSRRRREAGATGLWPAADARQPVRSPEMLVVMQAEASPAEIEAVCQGARDAGSEPTLYDSDPAVILVAGEEDAEAATWLAELPGVARLAPPRQSEPPV